MEKDLLLAQDTPQSFRQTALVLLAIPQHTKT